MEQEKQTWNTESTELSLTKLASSQYKMQLGINSVRDELKIIAETLKEIAEALKQR